MAPSIEILVHVSGPSRGADDVRYRREALGFLQFEPAERHVILEDGSSSREDIAEHTRSHTRTVNAEEDQCERLQVLSWAVKANDESRVPESLRTPVFTRPAASTLLSTAAKQTPHLLVERTPALPHPQPALTSSSQAPAPRHSQSDSWQTPPSEIPDSQPTRSPLGPPEVPSSPSLKRPFTSSSPSPTRHASPPAKRLRLEASSSTPSENPAVEKRPPPIAPFPLPPSTEGPQSDVPSSPPPKSLALEAAPHPALAPHSSASSATQNPPPSSTPPAHSTPQTLEIHPPHPKPSKDPFKTHLTNGLKGIVSRLPLEKHFQPISSTRKLEILERGHWLVPIHTWDEQLKTEFWAFLTKYVGAGSAGWGTWCVREKLQEQAVRASRKDSDKETERHEAPPQQGQLGQRGEGEVVKIYCWGEVVGEIWLLLFIGSRMKIKGVGARWIDAGGVAVVCMK